MRALMGLALRHMLFRRVRTLIMVGCIGIALALPAIGALLVADLDNSLRARARTAPLVVGAKGSRYDLVFATLFFRPGEIDTTPHGLYESLLEEPGVEAIPIHASFTAQGSPVVATSYEYFERRGLRIDEGRGLARLGEAVVGAEAARRLGVSPGDELSTDQRELYDITSPVSVRLGVVGVLEPTGTPDDGAVLIDLETVWVVEGIAHGHDEAESIERDDLLIGRTDEHVALSGAVITFQEISGENASSFHLHGSRDELPLTGVLVYPEDEKTSTILAARINASPGHQAVVPDRVVGDLMAFVVRIQSLLNAVAGVLGVSTLALIALIAVLSYRIREEEVRTLHDIGSPRRAVACLFGFELVLILAGGALLGALLSGAGVGATQVLVPFLSS